MIIAENTSSKKFLKLTSSLIATLRKKLTNSELILFLTLKSLNPFGDRRFTIIELTEILGVSKCTVYKNLRKLSKLGFITYESQRTTTYEVQQIALTKSESKTIELQKQKKFEDQVLKSSKTEFENQQTVSKSIEFEEKNQTVREFQTSNTFLETKENTLLEKDISNLKKIQNKNINESNQELYEQSQIENEVNPEIIDQPLDQTTLPCSANEVEYNPEDHKDYNSVILYLANYYFQNFPENTVDVFQGKKKAIAHIRKSRENWKNALANYEKSRKSPYKDFTGLHEKSNDQIPVNYRALELLSNFVKGLR